MTEPPYEPEHPGAGEPALPELPSVGPASVESARPQDTPHDPTRTFPTYGRPEPPPAQPPYGQNAGQPQYGPQVPPQYGGPVPPGYGPQPGGSPYGAGQYPPMYGHPAYAYGYGEPPRRANGMAMAALACGVGGIFVGVTAPVAIGLGIASLVQISRRGQAGKGMAIAGLVIGALVTIGYSLLIALIVWFATSVDDSEGPDPKPSTVYINELRIGDCFDDTSSDDELIARDCPDRHDAELIAVVMLPDGPFPGDSAIDRSADHACVGPFGTYVGKPRDQSELYLDWWTPDESSWNQGGRQVYCVAYGPANQKLVGSVKNSHR